MTPLQLKLARTAIALSIRDLAAAADVAPSTIVRFESGATGTQRRTINQLQRILEERGVIFVAAERGAGATVRLRE